MATELEAHIERILREHPKRRARRIARATHATFLGQSEVHNFRDGCSRNLRKSLACRFRGMKQLDHEITKSISRCNKPSHTSVRLPILDLLPSRPHRHAQSKRRLLRVGTPRDIRASDVRRRDAPGHDSLREVDGVEVRGRGRQAFLTRGWVAQLKKCSQLWQPGNASTVSEMVACIIVRTFA